MTSVLWGWRLEGTLVLSTYVALRLSSLIGPGGPVLLVGLTAIAAWQLPSQRRALLARLSTAHCTRVMTAAFWRCQILGRDGRAPRIVKVTNLPVGRGYLIRLPAGLHAASFEPRVPEIATVIGAREARLRPHATSAAFAELVVVTRDVLEHRIIGSPVLYAPSTSLWEPIPLGLGEDGPPVELTLPEHNLLIGGEPGSGKSVVLSSIVAAGALDRTTTLTLLDGKQVELAIWRPVTERFVGPDLADATETLEFLQSEMNLRYQQLLDQRRRKLERSDTQGLRLVVVDELALYLRGGTKALHDRFAEALRDLVSRGRAAGVIVVAATQKPSHEVVPTFVRDLFSYRMAMRCTSPEASDTILGQGWATRGYSASTIDPSQRGVGYLLAEGGIPKRFRAAYLTDEDIAVLAHRAEVLRSGR
jgi:phosphoglycolate phosphatase-like HAD superfamily hydrolase